MYGYNKYTELSLEEILKRASQEEIFSIVVQGNIDIEGGSKHRAPYREDNNGDCYFESHNGDILFVDFASPYRIKTMDCVQIIKATYRVDFWGALKIINEKLNLGLGDSNSKVRKTLVEDRPTSKLFIRKERTITLLPRLFGYKDKLFWSKYEITSDNLLEDGVIAVELYRGFARTGMPFTIRPLDICYAYTEFPEGRVKVYRPHASTKEAKWFTNCTQNDIGSVKHLPEKGDKLIITKSYKDCRVLRNQGLNAIWFQNEGMLPSKEELSKILPRFKEVIIWFDNDSAGIANSKVVKEYIESLELGIPVRVVMLPPKLLREENIKDPSDLMEKNKTELLNFIKKHKLY